VDTGPNDDGEPRLRFIIETNGDYQVWTLTPAHDLDPVPETWMPAVAGDAPPIATLPPRLRGTHVSKATALDETIATWRQAVPDGPVRIDLASTVKDIEAQMVVATAILLPLGTRARVLDEKQRELFADRGAEPPRGRSVLSMVIDSGEGVKAAGGTGWPLVDAVRRGVDALAKSGVTSVKVKVGGREVGDLMDGHRDIKPAKSKQAPAAATPAKRSTKRAPPKPGGKGKGRGKRS
jgi:hypothetical protein